MSFASQFTLSILTLGWLSAASCTGGDATGFEGTWTYNPGSSVTVTCPAATATGDASGNEEFRPGTDTDLVVISSDGCNLRYDAGGKRADAVPGQSCSTLQNGVTQVLTFNNASYTLQDGALSFIAAGTARVMGPDGEVTCTFTSSATLRKVSN